MVEKIKKSKALKEWKSFIDAALYAVFIACVMLSSMLIEHTWFFVSTANSWVIEKALILLVVSLFMIVYGVLCRLKGKSAHWIHVVGVLIIMAILIHINFAYL